MKPKTPCRMSSIPIFRKVIRKGSIFICGICRSEYDSRKDANNCLNFCWFEISRRKSVIHVHDVKQGDSYRCLYCGRKHKVEMAAVLCAKSCMERHNQLHIHEQLWNDLPLTSQRPRPLNLISCEHEYHQDVNSQQAHIWERIHLARITGRKELAEPIQDRRESLRDNSSSVHEKSPPKQQSEKPQTSAPKLAKEYVWRQTASGYECCICQRSFLSEQEAEDCFHSHKTT